MKIEPTSAIEPTNPSDKTSDPGATDALEGTLAADRGNLSLDESSGDSNGVVFNKTRIGRFLIESKLGEGGMGAVYRGRDESDSSTVAVKLLASHLIGNERARLRFMKEARLLARAEHPNTARLLEVGSEEDNVFLAVEYVPGGSLGSLLVPGEQLDLTFVLRVAADAVRGLAAGHERGIIHRDIKPDNILLTETGRAWLDALRSNSGSVEEPPVGEILAKLADFGIARLEHQSESLAMTHEGALLGTPIYMAPEQCLGSTVDARADIYSIGVTLYQLLAGRPPFQADSKIGLMTLHANEIPPALKNVRRDIPDALSQVVEKCLAKTKEARYGNGRELSLDLESLLRGEATSIGLHPPILSMKGANALTFQHSWDLASNPDELWPYVSHTDRVNHAIGFGAVNYRIEKDPVHGVQRFAETRAAGQKIRWQEHPYEWVEGKRLSVLREFTHGPFHWFVNVVELQRRADGGTRIVQTFTLSPKNWLGRLLAKIQLGAKSKRSFGDAYSKIDRYVQQSKSDPIADPWGSNVDAGPAVRDKLDGRLSQAAKRGADPAVLDALRECLLRSSELDVARIRPIAFAESRQLDRRKTIDAFLICTHTGALRLLWDILCPSCRIPSDIRETLSSIKDHSYCEACDLKFEIDLSRSVELIFRVHPEIRKAETRTYCIGGPAWSRHVAAQVRVAAGETFGCELELPVGDYCVRGTLLPFTVPFRVSETGVESDWSVSLAKAASKRAPVNLTPGSQFIRLINDSSKDFEIRLERTAHRTDALTASQVVTSALFRELFGDQVFSQGSMFSVEHIVLLLVKLCDSKQLYCELGDATAFSRIRAQLDRVCKIIREHSGAVVKTVGESIVAVFPDAEFALHAATLVKEQAIASELPVSSVIMSGPAMVTTIDERLDYFGRMPHEAWDHLQQSAPGEVLTSADIAARTEIAAWLNSRAMNAVEVSTAGGLDRPLVSLCPS
ncbi:MAG: protein kinase [Pirellulales bacterium]